MTRFIATLSLSVILFSCEENLDSSVSCEQGVEATVRDITGLDGCGFVFVLSDGTKLEPYQFIICGTPPLPKEVTEDPLYDFDWLDGKKVLIEYEEMPNRNSYCMAGPSVRITCLTEVDITQETAD